MSTEDIRQKQEVPLLGPVSCQSGMYAQICKHPSGNLEPGVAAYPWHIRQNQHRKVLPNHSKGVTNTVATAHVCRLEPCV